MIYAAVMGYGTIGSGVVKVIEEHNEYIAKKTGKDIRVKYILDLREFPGDPYEELIVHDVNVIMDDPEIDIVVETMGGTKPAYDFVKRALLSGKSVCTSNKALVAAYGPELLKIAEKRNANFLFEASVGGGIPIIRPLNTSLTADKVLAIQGILNGTTNYILTRMEDEGLGFEEVLKDAQALGYAEKDPTADVDGFDSCRKIAILSSLACGKTVDYRHIYTEGIRLITSEDFLYARKMGRSIKLIAQMYTSGFDTYAIVAPMMVAKTDPLYAVRDVFNAIKVTGDVVDDIMFYGKGAGSLPTASAVVADVIDAAKHIGINLKVFWNDELLQLGGIEEQKRRFFVRVKNSSKDIAAEKFVVEEFIDAGVEGETAFVTAEMSEMDFAAAVGAVPGVIARIRMC